MFSTFATNLSYRAFKRTSLLTRLLNLLKSAGTVFNWSTSALSTLAFELDFGAN